MSKPEDVFLQNAGNCGKETFDRAQELAIEGSKEAFGLYTESALQGSPAAAFMVSQYYSRRLEQGDELFPTFWATYAYMCGYAPAAKWLKDYFSRSETPMDADFFGYCERLSATNGVAAFMAGMGCYLGLGTRFDPAKAYSFFEKSAELGNPDGKCEKALCLMRGAGTERNKEKGLSLLLDAAGTGNIRAILKYAWCLEHGYCVPKDRAHALSIYLALANRKDPQAIYEAGRCYLDGIGVERDPDMAYGWFLVGQTLGGVKATFGMARCMLGGIVEDKRDEGLRLLKETADLGFPDAMVMLGQLYAKGGRILKKDEAKAMECFRQAADLGRASA
ncbi:MAG: sel1 repeat family protein, partial [Candidatus Methanomethylophilus sp.]|nr:sel1 repeat family protein [Methanomethylophilus sp.]